MSLILDFSIALLFGRSEYVHYSTVFLTTPSFHSLFDRQTRHQVHYPLQSLQPTNTRNISSFLGNANQGNKRHRCHLHHLWSLFILLQPTETTVSLVSLLLQLPKQQMPLPRCPRSRLGRYNSSLCISPLLSCSFKKCGRRNSSLFSYAFKTSI